MSRDPICIVTTSERSVISSRFISFDLLDRATSSFVCQLKLMILLTWWSRRVNKGVLKVKLSLIYYYSHLILMGGSISLE